VFASPVRIDRLLEADVRGIVGADDALRALRLDARGDAVRRLFASPPVVHGFDARTVEAARWIRERAATLQSILAEDCA
jgi:hypothetical protein